MERFRLKRGLVFTEGQNKWTVQGKNAFGKFNLEDLESNHQSLTESQIWSQYTTGQLKVDPTYLKEMSNDIYYRTTPRDLSSYSTEDQERAKYRQSYIKEVKTICIAHRVRFPSTPSKLDPLIEEAQTRLGLDTRPTSRTLHRWRKRSNEGKQIARLVNQSSTHATKRNPAHAALFTDAVDTVFLDIQRRPGKAVVSFIADAVNQLNKSRDADDKIVPPSRATVYRWLKDLQYDIASAARKGKKFTKKELRSVIGSVEAEHILSRVEVDHTPLNVIAICEETGLNLGRPWLTLAIDRKSRMILGFYISFHTPSAISVLQCLRMAILPKDELLSKYQDIKNQWPAKGLFDSVFVDNGMELHAHDVADACLELGADVVYCPVGIPEMKGCVERILGTINRDLATRLPGTTFASPSERGNYPSEKLAAFTLRDIVEAVVRWIVDEYHMKAHIGLKGKMPLEAWVEGESRRSIELPVDPSSLDLIVSRGESRTVFHYGIQYDNLFYNSPVLQDIKARHGGTPVVKMKAFDHSVGYISVFHPDHKEYFDVPANDVAYAAGLTRHVHTLICAETARRFRKNYNNEQLLEVRKHIEAQIARAVKAKKMRDRKTNAVLKNNNSAKEFDGVAEEALEQATAATTFSMQPPNPIVFDADDLPVVPITSLPLPTHRKGSAANPPRS